MRLRKGIVMMGDGLDDGLRQAPAMGDISAKVRMIDTQHRDFRLPKSATVGLSMLQDTLMAVIEIDFQNHFSNIMQ